jgi:hypothetical protein
LLRQVLFLFPVINLKEKKEKERKKKEEQERG